MKIKRLIIPLKILLVFLAVTIFLGNANATVTISNVSPPDGAIHVDIENNPPDGQGYVNLSFQLNDSTGGGDMEFYLDILSPKWSGNGGGYWSYYREIWIDNTGGSEINNSYINITLSSTNFDFSHAQPDGDDIRFIDNASDILSGDDLTQNTVRLWYNSSNQSAKFSVKIPNIPANTNYRIWIAYGNSKAVWTGLSDFYIYDDFSTDTTSEYERFDPDKWDYYFRYGYGAKTTANWTMEITDINAINWGGGICIGMSGENGTTITNRTYFDIRYNTDVGATESTAVVKFRCQNSSGSTDSGSWEAVLTEGNTYEFKIIVTDTYCRGIITTTSGSEVFNETLTSYIPEKLEYQWIGLLNYNDAGSVFEWSSSEGGYLHIKSQGAGNSGDDDAWIDTKLYYYKLLLENPDFSSLSYSIGSENSPSTPLGEWVNRLHLTDQNNGTWYHHEDTFNKTNSTYYWRICAKDGTTGTWTNETNSFTTDRKPNPPFEPHPANGSVVNAGGIVLKVNVTHPDASAGAKIYNVSFYEYPSGRLIGWNYSATGFTSGTIVRCNQTFYAPYKGTKYYWYARCKDDEYWSDSSSIFYFETYYDETEPDIVYYSTGADIYVKPVYTDAEPNIVYYSIGAEIRLYDIPHYYNPSPNGTTNEPLSVKLTVYVNKTGDETYWNFTFLTNCTTDGSWVEIGKVNNVKVLNSSLVEVSVWWGGLDWNTTYYWRVSAYNSTLDVYSNSSVYSFTTKLTDPEPDIVYYSTGSQIYVKPVYTEPEPSIVYYSLGAEINVYNIANLSNPYPANGSTNVWLSTPLRIDVNKTGSVMQLDIVFESNCTTDGSWVEIGRVTQSFPPNATIQIWWSGLDWNTTYYWRVKAINSTTGMTQYSDIYHFTTLRNDTEPDIVYYSLGADIYVKPVYTEPEPSIVYYSLGAEITVGKPWVGEPIPANNTAYGEPNLNFSVYVSDIDANDTIDKVEFYIDGSKYGEVLNVPAKSRVSIYVTGLTNWTWHIWYVKVYDDNWTITSDWWRYRPANHPPVIEESPINGSTSVAVYRKLVSGEWKHFVRLYWNLTDGDGDGMSFILWVKDPSTGTWIQRWTILNYSMHNGSYYQDEEIFNETGKTYYWKVWVSDGKNETTQIFHFYTQFLIDFWWHPKYPTQEDTVHFYSIVEGADTVNWSFGNGKYSDIFNDTTTVYRIANYYEVMLKIFNNTNMINHTLKKIIRIDRNITLKPGVNDTAGYNYFVWQGIKINATTLADILNLSKGSWIHKYNQTDKKWDSYFVGYGGKNFDIDNWDSCVIVTKNNRKVRINTTTNISTYQNISIKKGYNYISWSSPEDTTSANLSILRNGTWIFKYDLDNNKWYGYYVGVGGDDFDIVGYDTLVILSPEDYYIEIGG